MSRFFGKKEKSKDTQKFYVEFLGWIETRGLRGRKYTDPVVENLRQKQRNLQNPPKFTLQVSNQEIKISQDVEEKKKRKIKTVNYPIIPTRDVTFVSQATNPKTGRPDDIVACIYLGLVPRTQKYVHVHVYRFDTTETAAQYVKLLNNIIASYSQRTKEIELSLANKGLIHDPRLGDSDGLSDPRTDSVADSGASTYSGNSIPDLDDIEPDLQSLQEALAFDNVTDELKQRLNISKREGTPILLPPKDYDTISRARGNLESIEKRKCLNENIVGVNGVRPRSRNRSDESGIDISSPSEDSEDKMSEGKEKFEYDQDSPLSSPPHSARENPRDIYPPMSPRTPGTPPISARLPGSPAISARIPGTPPISARLPGTPKSLHERQIISRQQSFHSTHSSHSLRSLGGSSIDEGSAIIYQGERVTARVEDMPDYDDDGPIEMRKTGLNWRNANLNASMPDQRYQRNAISENLGQSMPAHILRNEQLYAVVNKKRVSSFKEESNDTAVYSPRSQINVRRVQSMYNYK